MIITDFYTPAAEGAKVVFYLLLGVCLVIGVWQRRQGQPDWANWIHAAVLLHFLVGGVYSGVRMLTTDEVDQMLTRRLFAWEAWFNFACAAFYFLLLSRPPRAVPGQR